MEVSNFLDSTFGFGFAIFTFSAFILLISTLVYEFLGKYFKNLCLLWRPFRQRSLESNQASTNLPLSKELKLESMQSQVTKLDKRLTAQFNAEVEELTDKSIQIPYSQRKPLHKNLLDPPPPYEKNTPRARLLIN